MNMMILEDHIRALSYAYPTALDDYCRHILVKGYNLPPGYKFSSIPALLEIPADYPESPPGVGDSHLYVPRGLRYHGRKPKEYHEDRGPSEDWAWWCYQHIDWDPCRDNLITFFELLRVHMTKPR
jgi:hypothetical protein